MVLKREAAAYRAWKEGVVHTTLNPKGPGAVRIHLIPPKYRPFGKNPYAMILNGYYILPLGYSWAVLLGNFIREVNRFDGRPMDEKDMEKVVTAAVERTGKSYRVPEEQLRGDLEEMLAMLYGVACGEEPSGEIEPLSLREYAPHMTAPHRMDLMVSAMIKADGGWNCNLQCRHCYAAGQPEAEGKELNTEQWKKIIDSLKSAGVPQVTFTGGEPTLRRDLVELVAYSRWFVTRLNTNGILLTPDLCRELYEASLDSVQITLYSWDSGIHDSLVGRKGGFHGTTEGIRNALNAGLNVSVNTPLCRDNQDYGKTLAFLNGLGVRYVTCSGLIETGNASSGGSVSSQLSVREMGEILTAAAEICRETGMEIGFTSPGRAEVKLLKRLGIPVPMCGACLSNMAVTPDGLAVPCQSWLGGVVLGDMKKDSWKSIWKHAMCKKIRAMGEEESLFCPLRTGKSEKGGET